MVTKVNNSNMPDLARLQQLLKESKAQAATGQAVLRDPEGFQTWQKIQAALEDALRIGRLDLAQEVAEVLKDLLAKEADLQRALEDQEAAHQNAETVIREVREEFGDKG